MTVLEFVSNLIESLAWPFVSMFFIWLLKEPVKKIFPFIERLKFKDFELSFRRQAEETNRSVDNEKNDPENIEHETLRISPKEAVLAAWTELEAAADKKYIELQPQLQKKEVGPDRAIGYF